MYGGFRMLNGEPVFKRARAGGSQVGEAGPQGLEGPRGPAGLDGATGAIGQPGPEGPEGIAGAIGQPGPEGPEGIAGAIGQTGPEGIAGSEGERGDKGERGEQGIQGLEGLMSDISHIQQGVQGETGIVEGLDDILARITTLEQYSPLTNISNGTVSDITYRNKEEIVFENQLTNSELQGAGVVVPWEPTALSCLQAWHSSKDLTSIPTAWIDLSGNDNHMSFYGTLAPTLDTTTYTFPTIRYHNDTEYDNGAKSYSLYPSTISNGKTFCMVYAHVSGSASRRALFDGGIYRSNNVYVATGDTNFNLASNAKHFINGEEKRPTDPWNNTHPTTISIVIVQTNGSSGNGVDINGYGKTSGNGRGNNSSLAELIVFDDYLDINDMKKLEGYLAHKYDLTTVLAPVVDNEPHPYRLVAPVNENGFALDGWEITSGNWDIDELLSNSVLISNTTDASVIVKQTVSLTAGEVYQVEIDRTDTNEGLVVKLKTDAVVKWLSHQNDQTDVVDVPHDSNAVFKVIGDVPTYIEIDTVVGNISITDVKLKRKRIANGTIEELSNNTIRKISGVDGWNAGSSSTECVSGQGAGYVQFQLAQSGKDIKVGLTYNDVDYINTTPYEMLFTGTSVFIQGVIRSSYISGDWFRIKHDSVNNQIVYQKRDSNLEYQTIHTDTTTTDGRNLYLDTSFYHLNGRVNDVSMVN